MTNVGRKIRVRDYSSTCIGCGDYYFDPIFCFRYCEFCLAPYHYGCELIEERVVDSMVRHIDFVCGRCEKTQTWHVEKSRLFRWFRWINYELELNCDCR